PKALVSDDQEVESSGRRAVLGRVDFLVGTVDAHAEYLDQDAAAARDVVHGGFRQVRAVDAVRFARNDGDSFHERRPPISELVPGSDDSPDPLRTSLRRRLTSGGISTRLTFAASSAARLYVVRYARHGAHTRRCASSCASASGVRAASR